MKTLEDDNLVTDTPAPVKDDILASLLGGYEDVPMELEPELSDEPEQQAAPAPVQTEPTQYYKTGAKAGQPKPSKTRTTTTTPAQPTPPATISGELLSGALFLTLIDLLLPFIIAELNNWKSPIKINSEDLQMTAKQKKELEPIADAVARKWNMSGDPVILGLIALAGIYGINTAALRAMKKAEMKAEALKQTPKK